MVTLSLSVQMPDDKLESFLKAVRIWERTDPNTIEMAIKLVSLAPKTDALKLFRELDFPFIASDGA